MLRFYGSCRINGAIFDRGLEWFSRNLRWKREEFGPAGCWVWFGMDVFGLAKIRYGAESLVLGLAGIWL